MSLLVPVFGWSRLLASAIPSGLYCLHKELWRSKRWSSKRWRSLPLRLGPHLSWLQWKQGSRRRAESEPQKAAWELSDCASSTSHLTEAGCKRFSFSSAQSTSQEQGKSPNLEHKKGVKQRHKRVSICFVADNGWQLPLQDQVLLCWRPPADTSPVIYYLPL